MCTNFLPLYGDTCRYPAARVHLTKGGELGLLSFFGALFVQYRKSACEGAIGLNLASGIGQCHLLNGKEIAKA